MRYTVQRFACGLLLLAWVTAPNTAEAQVLDRLKQKAKEKIEQQTDRPQAEAKPPSDAQTGAAQGAAATARPGEGAWANYDFVPGERVLFAEDFAKDRVGNFPRRFEFVQGNAEVVEWQGRRWLRTNDYTVFKVPLPQTLPERFTVEYEMLVPWGRSGIYFEEPERGGHQYGMDHRATSSTIVSGTEAGVYLGGNRGIHSTVDPRGVLAGFEFPEDGRLTMRPFHVRLHVDGRYIKMYLDEKRVANLPNGSFGRTNFIVFEFDGQPGGEANGPMITNISVNAGGLRMYDALLADGRVTTQGIFFDTGSDRLRPESTPTLKEIGEMLKEHPDLRVCIEGHTDNVGQAATNQTLSEKRAEAVRKYLVQSFGIAPTRLEAMGFGQSKPAAANDTPEGRQQNRRVELVRL
jgi:OmpA-OmpF porin, OOP family